MINLTIIFRLRVYISSLANTERWISDTLDRTNTAANARRDAVEQKKLEDEIERKAKMHFADETSKNQQQQEEQQSASSSSPPQRDNPYVRKEVSYVCETGNDLAVVVAGIFLRIREARELGESHGRDVEARLGELCGIFILYTSFFGYVMLHFLGYI